MRYALFVTAITLGSLLCFGPEAKAQVYYYNQGYNPYTGSYISGGQIITPVGVQSSRSFYNPYFGTSAQTTVVGDAFGRGYQQTTTYSPFTGYTTYRGVNTGNFSVGYTTGTFGNGFYYVPNNGVHYTNRGFFRGRGFRRW